MSTDKVEKAFVYFSTILRCHYCYDNPALQEWHCNDINRNVTQASLMIKEIDEYTLMNATHSINRPINMQWNVWISSDNSFKVLPFVNLSVYRCQSSPAAASAFAVSTSQTMYCEYIKYVQK